MICELRITDHINVGSVNRSFIDASEVLELIIQPTEEILRRVVLFGRSWRNSQKLGSHFLILLLSA
jgi:hypothetical protein